MKYKRLIAGSLMLGMLVLFAAIMSVLWASVSQAREMDFHWGIFHKGSVSVEADEEKRLAVHEPVTLVVKNAMGDITIAKGTEGEISIDAHKTAWGANQAEAEAALARLQVEITQENSVIAVQVESQEVSLFNAGEDNSVEFTITVPVETAVTAHTDFGKVALSGVSGNADLRSNYGDIIATDRNGGLIAHTASGHITARNIQGDEMTLDLRSDYGDISLERAAAGQIKAHSSSGLIHLAEVKAEDVKLSSDYGAIEFEAGWTPQLNVDAGSGKVSLTQLIIDKGLTVRNDYGHILITQVMAPSYDVSTNSGEINLDGANGSVKAHSDYGNVTVTNAVEVALDLSTNSGTIQFAGSLADDPHLLKTDYGDVRLVLPENTPLTLDLRTDYGRIASDLPLTLSGSLEETNWHGTFNGGGAKLTASTGSGNISIEALKP
jgi:DUF4097 and DUF4098 domain-containing protein YvlB